MRGAAILLVVFGHAIGYSPFQQLVYSFHMPLFIFLSGMAARIQYERMGGVYLPRRAWALLVPYFVWISISSISFDFTWLARVGMAAINPRAGGLWYLYVLLALYVVLWLLGRLPGSVVTWVVAAAVLTALLPHPGGVEPYSPQEVAALVTSGLSVANAAAGIAGWRSVLWFVPFFGAGFFHTSERLQRSLSRKRTGLFAGGVWVLLALVVWPPVAGIAGSSTTSHAIVLPRLPAIALPPYFYIWYRYAIAAAGIVMSAGLLVSVRGRLERGLAWIGRRTLPIYVLSGTFMAWLPDIPWRPVHSLLMAAFGIGMSVLISAAIERNPVASSLLLGRRWRRLPFRRLMWFSLATAGSVALLVALAHDGGSTALLLAVIFVLALLHAPKAWRRFALEPETE